MFPKRQTWYTWQTCAVRGGAPSRGVRGRSCSCRPPCRAPARAGSRSYRTATHGGKTSCFNYHIDRTFEMMSGALTYAEMSNNTCVHSQQCTKDSVF